MRAAGMSESTINERMLTIDRVEAQGVHLVDASTDDLIEWLATLKGRDGGMAANATRATYRTQLRGWFRWLHDEGYIEVDPGAKLPVVRVPRGVPRPLTMDQVEAVLAACQDGRSKTTRAYVILAAFAGLRVHEVAKVHANDVDEGRLRVKGKGGSDCVLPMGPRVRALAETMPLKGWWFPSPSGDGHVDRKSVGNAISKAMGRAGIRATPHQLRHFYGTQTLRAAKDVRVAQQALRHADIKSTAIYTQVAGADLAAAIAAVGDFSDEGDTAS